MIFRFIFLNGKRKICRIWFNSHSHVKGVAERIISESHVRSPKLASLSSNLLCNQDDDFMITTDIEQNHLIQ